MKNVANLIVFSMLIAFASTAVLEGKSRNNLIDERNVLSDEGKACIPESYGPCTSNSDCCQDETDWAGRKLGCYTHCSRTRCMTMKQCLFDSGVGLNWGRNSN